MVIRLGDLDGTRGFRLDGGGKFDLAGLSVAGAGDFNGDGYDDLIIGAEGYGSLSGEIAGHHYVIFGSDGGFPASIDLAALDGANGFLIDGVGRYAGLVGGIVSGARDVNSDGYDDVIIGAPLFSGAQIDAGEVYVVFGTGDALPARLPLVDLDGDNGFRLRGVVSSGQNGWSVGGVGDFNGDGYDDVVMGAPFGRDYTGDFDKALVGQAYVAYGAPGGFPAIRSVSELDGADGFQIDGIEPGDFTGYRVAGAGDVNGDGYADLIVGAPNANPGGGSGAGAVYIVFGAAEGVGGRLDLATIDGANGFRIDGAEAGAPIGQAISGAGDVNGDGYDDIIFGAGGVTDGSGSAYVVFGSPGGFAANMDVSDLDGSNGFRIDGVETGGFSLPPVSGAGDFNGDGYDDLFIGSPGADSGLTLDSGQAYVVFGGSGDFAPVLDLNSLDRSKGLRLDGDVANGGLQLASAGDVNGDGYGDLIVGTPYADTERGELAGQSYVVFGFATNDGVGGAPIAADDALDVGVGAVDLSQDSGAGLDFDPDYDDFAIIAINGVPVSPGQSLLLASGIEITFLKGTIVHLDAPGFALGEAITTSFSYAVSDRVGLTAEASVALTFAKNAISLSEIDGATGFEIGVGSAFVRGSRTVSGAGDVNGDGYDDVIIGVPDSGVGADLKRGASFVVFGHAGEIHATVDPSTLDGTNGFRIDGVSAGDESGASVSAAGDVNGDGFDDLIIGAPRADPRGRSSAGESYVLFGAATGFSASIDLATLDGGDGFKLEGIAASGSLGHSVAGAGDINGDGHDDLIIGAFWSNQSYVVFGSAGGYAPTVSLSTLNGVNGFTVDGSGVASYSGFSVSGAGDVNGDGYDDLIIGDSGVSSSTLVNPAGASFVVFGSASSSSARVSLSSLNGANGFRVDGVRAGDDSGYSISTAGDVNGDGYDDLIIGASRADFEGRRDAGASYVVFGAAGGFAASMELSELDGSNGFEIRGSSRDGYSGFSVSGAGDMNGDGYADLIIGEFGVDTPAGRDVGASHVLFGAAGGFGASIDLSKLNGVNGFTIVGDVVDSRSGYSVAGAGDVNGDGYDDVVIRSLLRSYVFFGSASPDDPGEPGLVAAVADLAAGVEDQALSIAIAGLLANDSPGSDGPIDLDSVFDAVNGTVALSGDEVIFTPTPDISGAASFRYRIVDRVGGVAEAQVTVTIAAVNDAPVADGDTATVSEDGPAVLIDALAGDTDVDGETLTITALSIPARGTATIVAGGVSFNPGGDFAFLDDGETATETLTYTVSDGDLTDSGTITVTVTGVNDAPVAVDDAVTALPGERVVVDVLTNDSDDAVLGASAVRMNDADPGSDGLIKTVADEGVFMVDAASGAIVFNPVASFRGQPGTVTYHLIDDGGLRSNDATVSIAVDPVEVRTVVTVHAAGTGDATGSPSFVVFADGVLLGAVEIADPVSEAQRRAEGLDFAPYTFELVGPRRPSRIEIVHADNVPTTLGNDVNLFVDRIEVDGRTFESELDGFYRTADGDPARSGAQEALWWNGTLAFELPTADEDGTRTLSVYAGGVGGPARMPRFAVVVDGVTLDVVEIGDPQSRASVRTSGYDVDRYDFVVSDLLAPETIKVVYLNDGRDPSSDEDLTLFVDRIEFDGAILQSEIDGVFTPVLEGPGRSGPREELHWNGALAFDLAGGAGPGDVDGSLTAAPMTLGVLAAGTIEAVGVEDWYRVTLEAGQVYRLDYFEESFWAVDKDIDVLSASLQEIDFFDGRGVYASDRTGGYRLFSVPEDGDYFVRLTGNEPNPSEVTLPNAYQVGVRVEEDLSADAGTSATLDSQVYSDSTGPFVLGVLETASDIDWIRIGAQRGIFMNFYARADAPILMNFRDADGTLIARGLPQGNSGFVSLERSSGGPYFIEIRSQSGSPTTSYVLSLYYDDNLGGSAVSLSAQSLTEGVLSEAEFEPVVDGLSFADTDRFDFRASQGVSYDVAVSGVDPVLVDYIAVVDRDGFEIARSSDGPVTFTSTYEGQYLIEVVGVANGAGLSYSVLAAATDNALS